MLYVHRATRADLLVDRLADLLATPPGGPGGPAFDPLQAELVAVHSRGIERWIAQRLAHRLGTGPSSDDGVAANIEFPFPGTVAHRALTATHDGNRAVGGDPTDPIDPWDPGPLAFTLLDMWEYGELDALDLSGFGRHVATDVHRRLPAFRHAAELLDSYQQHRPEMVRAWVAWDGTGTAPDGRGGGTPDHLAWQPRLLRAVRARLGTTRAEQVADAVHHMQVDTGPIPGLPPRISLFSLTALAAAHFEVLTAITDRIDVHVFLLHPSPAMWERDRDLAIRAPGAGMPRPARTTTPLSRAGHPLVTAWGRDSRELQLLLGDAGHDELLAAATSEPETLLERIQADVTANTSLPASRRWPLDPVDHSLQVHAAHGRHRQVEVARDAVLAALAADPSLEPRDIVVMTPDVETYAPLVSASFRAAATRDSGIPDLRVRLADRSLRITNPMMVCLGLLIDMADGRFEAGRVMDLLRRDPVRRRFSLTDGDVELLDDLVGQAQVKWGLDASHRDDHGLTTAVNTWRAGMDRLLAGLVSPRDRLADHVVPLDATTVDPRLVGALAEFVARLGHVRDRITDHDASHPVHRWRAVLDEAADLLMASDDHGQWQRWQLDTALADVVAAAGGSDAPVTLRELRGLLETRLAGRPSRANHQTGDLTVCSLVPMRTVPFRIVVVVGLDDGAWPRQRTRSGDDLLGLTPVVGDRDPASEDRQLLLDALMAARDQLVITYRGAHQATNHPVPPSVVVAELLDVIDDTAEVADRVRPRDLVVQRHPLRAADVRTFRSSRPHFDRLAAAGANAAMGEPDEVVPLVHEPPSEVAAVPTDLTLEGLVGVLANPARAWMRHCFGFTDRAADDPRDENLSVGATGLQGWGLGTQLLQALVDDTSVRDAVTRLRDAGELPVGRLAEPALDAHLPTARAIAAAHRAACATPPTGPPATGDGTGADQHPSPVTVDLSLSGTTLRGVVTPTVPGRLVRCTYSTFKPGNLLAGWVRLLAAVASGATIDLVDIAKSPSSSDNKLAISHVVAPPEAEVARDLLADLVAVARRVQTLPTPLFTNTSGAYWQARVDGKSEGAAIRAAGHHWSTGWPIQYGEGHDRNVIRMFGSAPLGALVTHLPAGTTPEPAPTWWRDDDMRHDLARWARRVYDPLWRRVETHDHGPVATEREAMT